MEETTTLFSKLGGWSTMASANVPPRSANIRQILKDVKKNTNEIIVCYDASGSTSYNSKISASGESFTTIYAKALMKLQEDLPVKHEIVTWSSEAVVLNEDQRTVFFNCLATNTAFANEIKGMGGGTDPETILNLVQNKTTIIITDGDISDSAIAKLQQKISASNMGSVVLVIVPHIDAYRDLYDGTPTETSAQNCIKTSLPRSFASRLATVLVWNYKKGEFEMIKSFTAPFAQSANSLKELLAHPLPVIQAGEYVIETNGSYKSFELDALISHLSRTSVDEDTIQEMLECGIHTAIRQQANTADKDKWNKFIMDLFNSTLNAKIKQEYSEKPATESMSIVELIRFSRRNAVERKKVESKYRNSIGTLFEKLLIDKTVSEFKSIAESRTVQTSANVNKFQSMSSSDKLDELADALPCGKCGICEQENINVFKIASVPTSLLVKLPLCVSTRTVTSKKGKSTNIATLDVNLMVEYLDQYQPRFYCLDLCAECAKTCMAQAKLPSDPEYGVTNLVPQNVSIDAAGNNVITNRLIIMPFVSPERINSAVNPNEPQLSFARQWLRGFISKVMGVEPASQECMKGVLAFITKLANDKPNAILVYATQTSILKGGAQNKYPETVGRLFQPSMKALSADTLTLICLVEPVIEMAEFSVLPESNRLLLLCLLDRQFTPILTASNQRERVKGLLDKNLMEIIENKNANLADKFGISDESVIKGYKSAAEFRDAQPNIYNQYLATYLQNTMGMNLQGLRLNEDRIQSILTATNLKDLSFCMNLNEDHLSKMVSKSRMTNEEFLTMMPKFLTELMNSTSREKMGLYEKFF